MKLRAKRMQIGRHAGLISSGLLLLGCIAAGAAQITIVDETFDPPFLVPLSDWSAGGLAWFSRDYANTGVGGSMAVELSGEFIPGAGHWFDTGIYLSGGVGGNELATPQNTVVSFDIKADRPDLQGVYIYLQGWKGVAWNSFDPALPVTASLGFIPLEKSTPGVFRHVVVAVNDSLWEEDPYSFPEIMPLFDPSSKTYQIGVGLGDGTFARAEGAFTVTVDNLTVTTKNAMIPLAGVESGDVRWVEGLEWAPIDIKATGISEHFGRYTETITFPQQPYAIFGPVEITVANGDTLQGFMSTGVFSPAAVPIQGEWCIVLGPGTGRFEGVTGSLNIRVAWSDATLTHYTAKCQGGLSTVGSNKK